MGFDPNLAILFSGVGTLIFFLLTRGRLPSYLGSSFSFIVVVTAITHYTGDGHAVDNGAALGGIMAAGCLYAIIGAIVTVTGSSWIERLMPPAVTGAVGAAIGLNLAPVAVHEAQGSAAHVIVATVTALSIGLLSVYASTGVKRVAIMAGLAVGLLLDIALGNGFGLLPPVDFAEIMRAPWFGMPHFQSPRFETSAVVLIAPVAFILIAENLGHIKAIGAMTGRNFDDLIGYGFIGDGLATIVSAAGGGTGVTTYVENMGVMAVTRVFSTLVFVSAGLTAILLGLSPKFGALLHAIPSPVLGGLAVVVFGLIAAAMIRLWVDNQIDFADPRNLFTVGISLVLGSGNFTVSIGGLPVSGIGTATLSAILLNQLFSLGLAKHSSDKQNAVATVAER